MPLLNKIVVCDDEDPIAHLVAMTLGDAGFLCLRARDGQQALFLCAREMPDLLVLDVMMPKLDGVAVARALKEDPRLASIPILMLTARVTTDDKVRGLEAGADDYLTKPFDLRELVARVRALVRARRRAVESSPVTGLPGAGALEEAVEQRIASGARFVLAHARLDGRDELMTALGWKRGEELEGALARAVTAAATAVVGGTLASSGVVVAHLGGGDFGLVAPSHAGERLPAALVEGVREALLAFGGRSARLRVTQIEGDQSATVDGLAHALAVAARASHPTKSDG